MTTYTTTAIATNSVTNTVTVVSIANMVPGIPITFSGTTFGGITTGSTYYIGTIIYGYPTSTITLTSLPGGAVFALTTATGSMTATWASGGQQMVSTIPPGENLNTAFTKINTNFDQIWAAGPVGSNIRIAGDTISTLDTNGDLVLNPNGTGNVTANAHVVPDQSRIRNLGSPSRYWDTIYVQYGNIGTLNPEQLTIPVANLHILGGNSNNVLQTDGAGNLSWTVPLALAGGDFNYSVQYNDNGVLNGSSSFTFDNSSNTVYVGNLVTDTANLNSLANITISGGQAGFVLQTDGTGNLSWVAPIGNTQQILDQQIVGDGTSLAYDLIMPAFTNTVMVSINGVMQLPSVAYVVSNETIVFSEPLLSSEIADIRFLVGGPSGNNHPNGANGSIQFNSGDGFGGSANLTYNAVTGNLYSTNAVVAGNVTASYYYGDGSQLSNIKATANTGDITFANNVISTSDSGNSINIVGPQQTPVVVATGGNAATSQLLWSTNIGALAPEDTFNAVVTGNTLGSQISAGNTGVVIASNSVAGLKTWTFANNGTLSSTSTIVAGNVNATRNVVANVDVSAVGNIVGTYVFANAAFMTGIPLLYGNSNVANYLNGYIGNVIPVANLSYSLGNSTQRWQELWVSNVHASGNITGANTVSARFFVGDGSGLINLPSNNTVPAGSNTQVQFNNSGAFGGSTGFTFNKTSNTLAVTGNVIGGNLQTGGIISATGNIQGQYILGNGAFLTGITGGGNYGNSNVATFLADFGSNTISTTGNVSAGNVLTSAEVIANGEIQSGTGFFTGGYLSVNGSTDLHNANVTGDLSVTGNVTSNTIVGNSNLHLQPDPANTGSYLDIFLTSGPDLHLVASASANLILGKDDGANVMTSWNGNAYIQSWDVGTNTQGGVWTFGGDGSTIFPTLDVQRGDNPSGAITGQTLLFGDAAQEAIISTPDGNPTDGINSQRLVINPGQGYGSGEGGDIYLWAGRGGPTDGSGGDVKIRGGQGMADGTGGYIRIEGGDTQGAGYPGYIDIKGGQGGTTQGAYVRITGGQGATNGGEAGVIGGYGTDVGGDANITAGYGGTNQGGNVNITGGGSALGLSGYGNVNVNAGASQWVFNNTGNLTTPQGGWIGAAGVKGDGTMLTGGTGQIASLTSFYADAPGVYSSCVTVNPDGTLNITTYGNGTGVLGQWVFSGANLTVPGNSVVSTPNAESGSGGNSISIAAGAADQFNFNAYAGGNLNLTGGLGGFNDDGVGGPGGNINISAGSPGEAGGHAGNVTVNAGTNTWTFDYTGNVAVPGNLNYEGVASPAPSINGFDSVNVITVNATGNISTTGNVSAGNLTTTGTVSATNIGNIASINLDGNASTVLYGNGVFAAVTGGGTYGDSNVNTLLAAWGSNTISTTGNITSGYLFGNGSQLTGLPATYGNSNVATLLSAFGSNTVSTTGNITSGYLFGNGSQLTGIVSSYGNANVTTLLSAFGSNTVSTTGTVYAGNTSTSGNATIGTALVIVGSTNTLQTTNGSAVQFANRVNFNQTGTSIVASGNISGTNLSGSTLSASGNVTGSYILGNGSQLTGIVSSYGNSNVTTLLAAFGSNTISTTGTITSGNITGGNVLTGGQVSATGNVSGANAIFTGTATTGVYALDVGAAATFLSNTVASFTANVNNYTQLTLQNLSTGADATADFILTADNGNDTVNYSDFGVINSGYDNATPTNSLGNIVYAADTYLYAQGNTGNTSQSGGNLAIGTTTSGKNVKIFAGGVTNSSIIANISNTGVAVTGTVSATGNIVTAGNFVGNGAALSNVTVSVAGNIVGTQANVGIVAGSYTWTFDNTGNITLPAGGDINMTSASSSINVGGTVNSYGNTNGTAFAVIGNGAASNVALGFFPTGNTPAEMAIRDYSTANSTMYFDTTIGSANTGGSFRFRSSNAYTVLATINTYGVVQPTKPGFRVYGNGVTSPLSTTQNGTGILNGNNWAVDYNQGSYLNSTTGVFTAPVAGLYTTNLNARVVNNTAASAQIAIIKNYATTANVQAMWETGSNPSINHFGVGSIAKLAAGDTLVIKVTLGTITFDGNDSWAVAFLG